MSQNIIRLLFALIYVQYSAGFSFFPDNREAKRVTYRNLVPSRLDRCFDSMELPSISENTSDA